MSDTFPVPADLYLNPTERQWLRETNEQLRNVIQARNPMSEERNVKLAFCAAMNLVGWSIAGANPELEAILVSTAAPLLRQYILAYRKGQNPNG